jgi:arylsulfatase A-like enzyme
VNLLSLFPTLTELAGLPRKEENDGPSLVPLLEDPTSPWPHVSLTFLAEPGSYGLSTDRWRHIFYANGDQELYDCRQDPHEWSNLADLPEHATRLKRFRSLAPDTFAPRLPPKDSKQ